MIRLKTTALYTLIFLLSPAVLAFVSVMHWPLWLFVPICFGLSLTMGFI